MPTSQELNNLGTEFFDKGDFEAARLHFLAALRFEPNSASILANIGVALNEQNKLPAAEAYFRKSIEINPNSSDQRNNLGNTLMRMERYGEAFSVLHNALIMSREDPAIWYNLGLLEARRGVYKTAIMHLNRAKELGAGDKINNDIAIVHLHRGDLLSAYEPMEARWITMPKLLPWTFDVPEWKGENIAGKHILFHGEQGFGDSIMCARFVKNLENLGAQVTLGLPPALIRLFSAQGHKVLDITKMDKTDASVFDFHSPMYSAMRWLKIEKKDINPDSYITPPNIVTPNVSGDLKVGICWASGLRGNTYDWRRRIAPLNLWLPLISKPGVSLYSLQIGEQGRDISELGCEGLIFDPTHSFSDWADTSAFISKLDLVISVDTAVAHLAGAMGKAVWMLSQHQACWRWWSPNSGLPWYRRMTIFRQTHPGEWDKQLKTCAEWLDRSNVYASDESCAA